ncbi:hypothetical protein DUNSADRAFT_12177 [Dunaliella salina]|uniref:Encoded protein n=1 Tax=Dunaliella salina TaxID=3046 RepID=A0ABQ7GBT5_DUNSA|nr:hypothetical protein DUNSADRAFT_12177 [Dunaliella salina]|eukprot:KAF5832064.1 hypothetical protein DUNSADRAFT_12177 [Dunaliella salina]
MCLSQKLMLVCVCSSGGTHEPVASLLAACLNCEMMQARSKASRRLKPLVHSLLHFLRAEPELQNIQPQKGTGFA